MKIELDKRGFFWEDSEKVLNRLDELRDDQSAFSEEEQNRMMNFYCENAFCTKILEFKATVAHNGDPLMEGDDNFDPTIDVWISMFVEAFSVCYRIGFFLQDFWTLNSENRDEVRQKAYIRKFIVE